MRPHRAAGVPLSLALLVAAAFADHHRPPRVYDLRHVKWALAYDEAAGTIRGDVTNTVVPLRPGTKRIWFDSARLNIQSVAVNGKKAPFRLEGDRLYVGLPKAMGPTSTLSVRILYTGRPEAGIYFVPAARAFPSKTGMVYTQGEMEDTRYYLPTYDYPDDKATSESLVTAPAGHTVISNGRLLRVRGDGKGNQVWHHKMDQPHVTYLISLVAGPYATVTEQWEKIPVRYNVPPGLEEMGRSSFAGTDRMLAFFSRLTGVKYPYAKFDQSVVADYMFGGMENITAVTNTITTLHPASSKPIESSEGLVAHELAHQWFGDIVTCRDWSHAWINESFATLLPHFWVREARGEEDFDLDRYETFRGSLESQASTNRPVVYEAYEEPMEVFTGQIYGGGAARLFVLMHELGEPLFWNVVKSFLNEHRFKSVATQQFFASAGRAAGRDLRPFMRQWFYTPALPRLTVTQEGDSLVIRQAEPVFTLNLEVWTLENERVKQTQVNLTGRQATVPNPGGGAFFVDPNVRYPAQIDLNLSWTPERILRMYRLAPNAAQKARLIDTLFEKLSPEQKAVLLRDTKHPRLVARMVGKLSDVATLLELTRHEDARVVDAAVRTLGSLPGAEPTNARLRELLNSHPNPALRQRALETLVGLTKDERLVRWAWKEPKYDDGFRVFAMRWLAENRADEARELALKVLEQPDSEPLRIAALEALGKVKDRPGERRVFEALARVARERSFGARSAAFEALVAYGDPAAVPAIQTAANHGLHFMRRRARQAVQELSGKRS